MLNRILRKLFTLSNSKLRLSRPTNEEQRLINELRQDFAKLDGHAIANDIWSEYLRSLRKLVANSDPRGFLRWKPIFDTMFVDYAPYVETELSYLKRDWRRWKPIIKEDKAGSPVPYYLAPSTSANAITHAYHLAKFEEVTGKRISEIESILEFGGGYGSMCRLIHRAGFKGKYTIFDLPEFSALQSYYLNSVGVRATLTSKVDDLQPAALFVATWSLSESPLELREQLLPVLKESESFLIGYQEELEGVDNVTYFKNLQNEIPLNWHEWRTGDAPGKNWYLMGG